MNTTKRFRRNRRSNAVIEPVEVRRLLSTVVVDTLADESLANSTTSLREAIAKAAAGDTVAFKSGLSGQITLAGTQLEIDKNLTSPLGARGFEIEPPRPYAWPP
jgi:CSLREA domain-containing protein